MNFLGRLALTAAVVVLGSTAAWAGRLNDPVVVELFTSQGCSSCAPADRLMGELAQRDDVLALTFHVNYWDYIGWADPFASEETTQRQRDYARAFGQRNVYTPEIVIGGVTHRVGSDVSAVKGAIRDVGGAPTAGAKVELEMIGPEVLRVSLGASHYFGSADVLLVRFDERHETEVARGENAGRTIVNYNVVRDYRKIGTWSGQPRVFDLDWSDVTSQGRDRCAVIVQAAGMGPVLGAAEFDMASVQ